MGGGMPAARRATAGRADHGLDGPVGHMRKHAVPGADIPDGPDQVVANVGGIGEPALENLSGIDGKQFAFTGGQEAPAIPHAAHQGVVEPLFGRGQHRTPVQSPTHCTVQPVGQDRETFVPMPDQDQWLKT